MIIGLLCLEIHLPFSRSLKEKRKTLNSLKDRIINKYNVAFAELEYQEKWQRAKLGFVTLNSEKRVVDQVLAKVLAEAEENSEAEILDHEILYF